MNEAEHDRQKEYFENHVRLAAKRRPESLKKELNQLISDMENLKKWESEFDEEDKEDMKNYIAKINIIQSYM